MWIDVLETIFPSNKQPHRREMVMEELHRIHKDVPFGYWVDLVVPTYRAIVRRLRAPRKAPAAASSQVRLIGLR